MSTEQFPNEADTAVPIPTFTVPDKVDTLDTIPPILRPQYAQNAEGKYIFRHANGLMSALEKTKVERDEAKTTAKQHQDALRAIVGEFDINDLAEPDTLKQRVVEQILAHEAAQRKDDAGVTFDQKVKEALDAQAGNYEKKLITTQRENAQKAEQVKVAYKALEEQAAVAEFALALNKFQLTEIGRAFLPKQLADDTYRVFDSTSLHTTVFVRNTENNGTDLDNDYRMNAEGKPMTLSELITSVYMTKYPEAFMVEVPASGGVGETYSGNLATSRANQKRGTIEITADEARRDPKKLAELKKQHGRDNIRIVAQLSNTR